MYTYCCARVLGWQVRGRFIFSSVYLRVNSRTKNEQYILVTILNTTKRMTRREMSNQLGGLHVRKAFTLTR